MARRTTRGTKNNNKRNGVARSKSASSRKTDGRKTSRKMSRAQAGRLGGLAPHSCRGRECSTKKKNGRGRSASTTRSTYAARARRGKEEEKGWFDW